ncbi:GNAT family N-acetyltransferase [Nonomuraea sp. NN258]|uniref:GNAT family N-acetyltransferase n=1 Tax=Nonomuraea antri TaxID=2730852 RepID=UPI0015696EA3|nr:GNAT family protein [Nonomuraea antri]NRQ40591.1 GNAT family N-acetyltransferase [Nonomuraea antri]
MNTALSPAREDDLPFLNRLTNDPEATGPHQWLGWHSPHHYRRRWEEDGLIGDDRGMLLIVDGDDRVGFVSWSRQRTSREGHCWEMGLIVAPEFRGRGHGTRAQRLLVRYLFDHTTVNRVQASTEVTNLAEQRSLEKAGFTREGVLRGVSFRAGEWHDGVLYSVIRADLKDADPGV